MSDATYLRVAVHRRADGQRYMPLDAAQATQLGVRIGDALIIHHGAWVMTAELRTHDGQLHVHVDSGVPSGAAVVHVRRPRR